MLHCPTPAPLCYFCFDLEGYVADLTGSGVLVPIIARLLGDSSFVLGESIVVLVSINNEERQWGDQNIFLDVQVMALAILHQRVIHVV